MVRHDMRSSCCAAPLPLPCCLHGASAQAAALLLQPHAMLITLSCCRYVVLNRPWAFVQWLRKARIKERFVLMSEPDHIWLKPMPNLMHGNRPAAFPFFYIEPAKKEFLPITEKFTGKLTLRQAESIAPIGELAVSTVHAALVQAAI